ncbi:hypothetical protein L1D14_20455 [Vibrio tubiashii]|uniref:hypothetical protein n=1 Tax=Vibrio tubiashii TaxID=29498 RepID=UPI001EFCEDDD|nr:hypothetical protein [Vibrio tubiashii]MCG9578593.1 hypothetical protein [Vibrio tubiashii]
MLNIYSDKIVLELAKTALNTDFVSVNDFKRSKYEPLKKLQFDIYVTLAYLGFFESEQLSYANVLERVPTKYLPCDAEQSETFHVTSATISRLVTQFTPFIKSNLFAPISDSNKLKELEQQLPVTLSQANDFLVSHGIISSPVSARAIEFLFDCFIGESRVKSLVIAKSNKEKDVNGERYERNTRPSMRVLCLAEQERHAKNFADSIVRSCDWLGRMVGLIDFRLVSDFIVPLNSTVVKSLGSKSTHIVDFTLSICREKYSSYERDFAVSEDLHDSEFATLLWKYLNAVPSLKVTKLPEFLTRILMNKAGGKSKSKSQKSRVISSSVVLEHWDVEYLTDEMLQVLMSAIDFVVPDGDSYSLRSGAFLDVEQDASIALSTLIDYLQEYGTFSEELSSQERVSLLLKKHSSLLRDKLLSALDSPEGFFEKHGTSYSVSASNRETRTNLSGSYIRPDYDLVSDELFSERVIYQEDDAELRSRFNFLMDAYKKRWGKTVNVSDLLVSDDHELHLEYITDRKLILTTSHFRQCEYWIKSEIKRGKRLIESHISYVNYLVSLSEKVDSKVSIAHSHQRIAKWKEIVSIFESELEMIYASEPYKRYVEHIDLVNELLEQRSKLALKPSQYKANMVLHDYIAERSEESGESVERSVLERFIESYCQSIVGELTTDSTKKSVSDHHNLRRLIGDAIAYHPFAV